MKRFGNIIVCAEHYFEPNDYTPRMEVSFINLDAKEFTTFLCPTSDFEEMVKFLMREVNSSKKQQYIP